MKIKALPLLAAALVCTSAMLSSCSRADKAYATESIVSTASTTEKKSTVKSNEKVRRPSIMSDDKIMPRFIDISLFDEENYSAVYLGKKFRFRASFAGTDLNVPTKLSVLEAAGWHLAQDADCDENGLLYARDSHEAVFENESGARLTALFFNSSKSSVKMGGCNIVRLRIENDFYLTPDEFNEFNVNGINNKMAVTDVIDTLGTPSHFYGNGETEYYLDYFISKDDRRNGITVYINPVDDLITAIEFSYYK